MNTPIFTTIAVAAVAAIAWLHHNKEKEEPQAINGKVFYHDRLMTLAEKELER